MRNKIFISHSNPEDNDQARWLGLQLLAMGYEVWCDVFNLKGGEKFWKDIEFEIRNNVCKFLYVLTPNSNQKDGCLNELSVAESVEKKIGDKHFIIALHFDSKLNYDDVNINLKRKIDLDFKTDWQKGMNSLLKIFDEDPKVCISKEHDFESIHKYWSSIYLHNRRPIEKEEIYSSNWFPVVKYPEYLFFHNFHGLIEKDHDWSKMKYPTYGYKKLTATFAYHYNFIEQIPKSINYDPTKSLKYPVTEILENKLSDNFISNKSLQNILNNLINTSFINAMKKRSDILLPYEMSKKTSFYFIKDINDSKQFSFGQLVGKLLERDWHFAFSGFPDLINNVFVIRSHIVLSENGSLIESKRIQQSGRRKQGSKWWNKHWKQKLISAVSNIVDNDGLLRLEIGSNNYIHIAGEPIVFISNVSYLDPDESREALDDFPEDDENIELTEK